MSACLRLATELTIKLRGRDVTAALLVDGKIRYQEQTYDGPLACATSVRRQTCDGWFCWTAVDHTADRSYPITHYRTAVRRQREESPT